MNTVPGVDMSTGGLGQGISCAAGMPKPRPAQDNVRVYALLGDEIEEGEVWAKRSLRRQVQTGQSLCHY